MTIWIISDQEDEEEEDDAGDDENRAVEGGLSERYLQALADSGTASNQEDHSFTRYIKASQMSM